MMMTTTSTQGHRNKSFVYFTVSILVLGSFLKVAGDADIISKAQEVTTAILKESRCSKETHVFVSDRVVPATSVLKVVSNLGYTANVAYFEALLKKSNSSNSTTLSQPSIFHSIDKIRKTSWCLTLIVISDVEEFLVFFTDTAASNGLLKWPVRLLVLTRLTRLRSRHLRQKLSTSNGMMVTLQDEVAPFRCEIFIYLPNDHRRLQIATWSTRFGLRYLTDYTLFPDKFSRLTNNAHLVVAAQGLSPYLFAKKTQTANGTSTTFYGPSLMLLELLARRVNFTYSIVQPPDGSFGSLLPNGSWNGMVGMVVRKEVDLALGPFAITYDRSMAVDFSFPLLVDNVKILGRRGRTEVDEWSFVMPLGPLVWLMTFISLLALVVVTKLLRMIGSKIIPFGGGAGYSSYIRIIFQQDVEDRESLAWERLMVCSWALSVFVVIASYESNLMSLLAVRYISEPYQTWRDMVDDESLVIIQFANTAQTQMLSAAESGIFHDVAEAGKRGRYSLIPVPGFVPVVDKLVSRGDHVFLAPFLMMKLFLTENYMYKGNCKFYASSESFMDSHLSLVFQKDSPLRHAMDRRIKGAIEGGLYSYWINDAIPNVGSCKRPPTKITVQEPLSMTNLWGMFVVLAAGCVASFVAFVSEATAAKILACREEKKLNLYHE